MLEAQRASETSVACYKLQISEFKKALEDKENEITVTVLKYEEKLSEMEAKLRKLEDKQNSTEIETQKIVDRAARDVIFYKKRSMELEQENNRLQRQAMEQTSTQSLRKPYENPMPGPSSSSYLNSPHIPVAHSLPQRAKQQSILKKTSAYNLNVSISNPRKTFVSSPDDFNSQHNSVSENKKDELPSSSPVSHISSSSTNSLEPTAAPSETCQNNVSTPEKSKFGVVKKRKLFRPNDQDFD